MKNSKLSNVTPRILGSVDIECPLDLIGPGGKHGRGRLLPKKKKVPLPETIMEGVEVHV